MTPPQPGANGPPPRAVLLNFFAAHVLDRAGGEPDVPTTAAIEVCRRVGIAEHAVRSTLNRMVIRDLLRRERTGRTTVYRLTDRARAAMREGRRRVEDAGAVRDEADGSWVLLAFNMPSAAQRERHVLRTRLTWAGFGPLQGGLWIAPDHADLSRLIDDPQLRPHLRVFTAHAHPVTRIAELAPSIWELDAIADSYQSFIARWSDEPAGVAEDALARQILLGYEWLEILRRDPRLPRDCLPDPWPAAEARGIFRRAAASCEAAAEEIVQNLLRAG